MAKAGYCSVCNENVYLKEDGSCPKGHPSNCISGAYDTEQAAAAPTAATAPVAKAKKPFYKKWWVWAIAVLVIGAIASGGSGGGETPSTDTAAKPAASAEPAANTEEPAAEAPKEEAPKAEVAKIGDPLKVGDLVFTAKSSKSTTTLKSPLGNQTGSWILVDVKVENKGKEAVMINTDFFKLVEADGTTYETDSDNLMYLPGESFFLENINPKMSKEGTVLFAVPEGLKGLKLQVQTGFFGTETGEISLTK